LLPAGLEPHQKIITAYLDVHLHHVIRRGLAGNLGDLIVSVAITPAGDR
jgi:hypothetical protein